MRSFIVFLLLGASISSAQVEQNSNRELRRLSHLFFEDKTDTLFKSQYLDSIKMNYSLESLKQVDSFLVDLHINTNVDTIPDIVVIRAGAYLGEVIRRHSKKHWLWLNYKQARAIGNKTFNKLDRTVVLSAVLSDGNFFFPLAKIQKYLVTGGTDDLYFYGQVLSSKN